MSRLLLLTTTVLITISLLPSPTVQTQEPEKDQRPNFERDYPDAAPNCKSKDTLAPFLTHPEVAPQRSRCRLSVYNCKTDKTDVYLSLPRPSGTVDLDCHEYEEDFERMKKIEFCCDRCGPPTPWFDKSLPCKEPKHSLITISGGTAILYMCEYPVFHNADVGTDPLFAEAYRGALQGYLAARGLEKVCCDKFNDAVRTGQPCDPSKDADCDGEPNKSDSLVGFPSIDARFSMAPGVEARFPDGMTSDVIMPRESCEDCKWELTKAELKCNPDKTKGHSYEATWRCPTTGQVVPVKKFSKPGVPCP